MAKLIYEDLVLEFLPTSYWESGYENGFDFKVTMTWKGIPVLNEDVMKRHSTYWDKGAVGGLVASEEDFYNLFHDLETAIKTKQTQIWQSFPDTDMCISIYPERCFPYLDERDSEYYTVIVSPDSYQFKESDCYIGYSGVSFVMTPKVDEFETFVAEFKKESDAFIAQKKIKAN